MDKLKKDLQIYKQSEGALGSIKAISCEFFAGFDGLDGEELKLELSKKMGQLLGELSQSELTNTQNLKSAMQGINQALVGQKERELYELLDKQDEISRKIKQTQESIRQSLRVSFETAEQVVLGSQIEQKQEALNLLNDAIMRETRMLWILKESSQNAFLTTIENQINVEQTICQIAKNMTYSSINEDEFSKQRALEISKTIISSAAEVANEGHIYAKELINGAVIGTKEGLESVAATLKDEAKFAPNELKHSIKEIKNLEQEFVQMLHELQNSLAAPAKDELRQILQNNIDSTLAKLKRLSDQASQELHEKLDEIKANPSIAELIHNTNEKIESLKKELDDVEKRVKSSKIAEEAKKMGDRAYKAAKELLANLTNEKKQ